MPAGSDASFCRKGRYVPNRLEVASPAAHLAKATKSRVERDIFIYHRALCARIRSRANGYNAGKMMRNYLAFAFLREADDIMVRRASFVQCYDQQPVEPRMSEGV